MPAHEDLSFLDIFQSGINQWHEKHVQLRGFLYRDEQGNLILAHEPNLKSCCIGSNSKKSKQVLILGYHIPDLSKSAITIKGQFFVNKDSEYGYTIIKN